MRRKTINRKSCCLYAATLVAGIVAGSAQAEFQVVDDFNDLALGNIDTQNGWVSTGDSGQVVTDPAGGSNQVLKIETESGLLHHPASVLQGTDRMLFLRFRFEEHSRYSFGLSHLSNPDEYSDFGPELGMAASTASDPKDDFRVAGGNAGVYEVLETLTPNTWYNTWVQVNNEADNYEVWMNAVVDGDASIDDKLDSDSGQTLFDFRTGGSNDLINFYVKTSSGSSPIEGLFYIDDIYLEDSNGLNLTNPAGGPPAVIPLPAAAWLLLSGLLPLLAFRRTG